MLRICCLSTKQATVIGLQSFRNCQTRNSNVSQIWPAINFSTNAKSVRLEPPSSYQRKQHKTDGEKIAPLGYFLLLIPITTFGLGCWQIKRKIWKETLLKELETQINKPPVDLPDDLQDLEKMEYQKIKVRGHFLHDRELVMGLRSLIQKGDSGGSGGLISQQNGMLGYHIVTPFKLENREETILINRGWVPKKFKDPETRKEGQIKGDIELSGVVRLGEARPQFQPDHNKGNVYLYRDLDRMCRETNADPIFIDADVQSSIPDGPVGGQTRITLRNEHLSYVFTWFSLSAFTSIMWYKQILRRVPF